MTAERDLLRDLQTVLSSADVDVTALVEGAWAEAQEEVRSTLRRMMAHDLLARSLATLQGEGAPAPAAAPEPDGPARAVGPSASESPTEGDHLTYLFGVVGPDSSLPRSELPRMPGGGPLRLLDVRAGQALVCDVDPAVFEVLRRPGPDGLDVLAAAAQVHDAVLARFVDAPVLPLPLGTALPDDATVIDLLDRHVIELTRELERLSGLAEWSVTVRTIEPAGEPDAPDTPASGREYLERRREALSHRERRWADQEAFAEAVHGPLEACAVAGRRVHGRPLEEAAPPLVHGVYLVASDAVDRFESTLAYLRGEHPDAVIEVTGPLPPYHFTEVDLSAGAEPAS